MRDTEVRREEKPETIGNPCDSGSEPRAVLPAALPAGARAPVAPSDVLGEPLSIAEVARLIGCSVWTVRQRCLPRGLPHFRLGGLGKLIFYRNQIVRWIVENQRKERR